MSISVWLCNESLPVRFTPGRPLSDADFQQFCFQNDLVQIERAADGTICLNPLNCASTSEANSAITAGLREWWHRHKTGRTVGSAAGFFLPDGSMLCPDAAYISAEKMQALDYAGLAGIPHVCPDFVIELLANWERHESVERKMATWLANGVQLAWLIDPYRRTASIYEPNSAIRWVSDPVIRGSGPVDGFAFDLEEIWRCYELTPAKE